MDAIRRALGVAPISQATSGKPQGLPDGSLVVMPSAAARAPRLPATPDRPYRHTLAAANLSTADLGANHRPETRTLRNLRRSKLPFHQAAESPTTSRMVLSRVTRVSSSIIAWATSIRSKGST